MRMNKDIRELNHTNNTGSQKIICVKNFKLEVSRFKFGKK
ncbi:hypothetical protein T07_13646 [Trichinella nelsoni]|uniref:Uncharacterized protein n=1 Tax=Trichinella nelsoni TaxID=6336 RepID=A0A0V0RAQ7_9BILA|nr:hypothetical protein T07_13646 [Trichinella nelsoni]